jgi:hypothetical protein
LPVVSERGTDVAKSPPSLGAIEEGLAAIWHEQNRLCELGDSFLIRLLLECRVAAVKVELRLRPD